MTNFKYSPKTISLDSLKITKESIHNYITLFEKKPITQNSSKIPQIFLIAYILKQILTKLNLPGGTIHSSLEWENHSTIKIGEIINGNFEISKFSERTNFSFIQTKFTIQKNKTLTVLKGATSVIIPNKL